jgi:RHS repeat-associated protein
MLIRLYGESGRVALLFSPLRLILGAIAILAFTTPSQATNFDLRWSQYHGNAGPITSVFGDYLPVSNDGVNFRARIETNEHSRPGLYILKSSIYTFSFNDRFVFRVAADDGQIMVAIVGNWTKVGYKHEVWVGSLAADNTPNTNGSINVQYYVEGPDPKNPQLRKNTHQADYTINGRLVWNDPYYPIFFRPMTNRYLPPISSDEIWRVCLKLDGDGRPSCGSGGCGSCGMATHSLDTARAAYSITDTPVSYSPPRGRGMNFTAKYNMVEPNHEDDFTYFNMGKNWTCSLVSYIYDGPPANREKAIRYLPGGGEEIYSGWHKDDIYGKGDKDTYAVQNDSGAKLRWVSDGAHPENNHFRRDLPDGSYELYGAHDGHGRYFLTEQVEAHPDNTMTYTYETITEGLRLTTITDALSQETTLSYEDTDPLKITKVLDPFGRFAVLAYSNGKLASITDPVSIVSQFQYDVTGRLNRLITPYGTTSFALSETVGQRILTVTNPQGAQERVEYRDWCPYVPSAETTAPAVMAEHNADLDYYNSFYWTKKAMMVAKDDGDPINSSDFYAKAIVTHYLAGERGVTQMVGSSKNPLETRAWQVYQGQTQPNRFDDQTQNAVAITARQVPHVSTPETLVDQVSRYEYNELLKLLKTVDPLGRTTYYEYDATGMDLLKVKQKVGESTVTLTEYSDYDDHQAWTITGPDGQSTGGTYNSFGQPLVVSNAENETTTYDYDSNGYLQMVTGNDSEQITTYTYDSAGRIETVTDSDDYTVTTEYDNLDRITKIIYPNGSYEETKYKWLDAEWRRDALGRWTHYFHDQLRRVVKVEDPLERTTKFNYCICGALHGMTDPAGNITSWEYDLQGRILNKKYIDTTESKVYYDLVGRISKTEDALGQNANYRYNIDGTLNDISYSDVVNPTANVSYTYDSDFGRLVSMTDGIGTTEYEYNPYNESTGSGRLHTITQPLLEGDPVQISYTYDSLGRQIGRSIDGMTQDVTFDSLERLSTITNSLGIFTMHYDGTTGRVLSIEYPNGQKTFYEYDNNIGIRRLKQIRYENSNENTISRFDYTYDSIGNIESFSIKRPHISSAPNQKYYFGYDAVDQIKSAELINTDDQVLLKRYDYTYDPVGNRLNEQISDGSNLNPNKFTYNSLNQLTIQEPGKGMIRIEGVVSKTATVTINSQNIPVDTNKRFMGEIQTSGGNQNFTVAATDSLSQTTTKEYQVTNATEDQKDFDYDLNGNMTEISSESTTIVSYEWDALNRLIKITKASPANVIEFIYDGLSRRVGEKLNGILIKQWVWCGNSICEERDGSGVLTKQFHPQGVKIIENSSPSNKLFYIRDHLGTVRDLTDNDEEIRGSWDYDIFGKRSLNLIVDDPLDSDMAYAGFYFHPLGDLYLALYRPYEASLGRWLCRDLIKEKGGVNLYRMVGNSPVNYNDFLGLDLDRLIDTENGPRAGDHLRGGTEYLDQTKWFEEHYRGWKSEAQNRFSSEINSWVFAHCGKSPFPGPSTRISIYPGRHEGPGKISSGPADDGGNEGEHGDLPQTEFSADKVLGSFTFDYVTPVDIKYRVNGGFSWKTEMYVEDVLGLQPGDAIYNKTTGYLFPSRKVKRGKWTIRGGGKCCLVTGT